MAEQSPALRALVSGFMEEAQIGTAIWEKVDEETFSRFAEFVYTGDYPPPSWNTVEDSSAANYDDPPIEELIALLPAEPEQDSNIGFEFESS